MTGQEPGLTTLDPDVLLRLRDYVRAQVRSGVHRPADLLDLAREAAGWIGRTDPQRLDAAMARLGGDGFCTPPVQPERAALDAALRTRSSGEPDPGSPVSGGVGYTVPDIWTALETGRLALTVVDADGRPAGRRSGVINQVIDTLADEGLLAGPVHDGDGQVVVTVHWRRRPGG